MQTGNHQILTLDGTSPYKMGQHALDKRQLGLTMAAGMGIKEALQDLGELMPHGLVRAMRKTRGNGQIVNQE